MSWYDRDGRRGDTLDTGFIQDIALSPDGTRIAEGIVESPSSNRDLWIYDVNRRTKTRLTTSLEDDGSPVWQPDGQFVLFASGIGTNPYHTYRARSDGSGESRPFFKSEDVNEVTGIDLS